MRRGRRRAGPRAGRRAGPRPGRGPARGAAGAASWTAAAAGAAAGAAASPAAGGPPPAGACGAAPAGESRETLLASLFGAPAEARWGTAPAFLHGALPQAIVLDRAPAAARGQVLPLLGAVPRLRVGRPVPKHLEKYGWNAFVAFNPSVRAARASGRRSGERFLVAWRHTNHNNCHNFFQPIAPNKEDAVGVAVVGAGLRPAAGRAWLLRPRGPGGAAVEDCRVLPLRPPGRSAEAAAAAPVPWRLSCWAVSDPAAQAGAAVLVELAARGRGAGGATAEGPAAAALGVARVTPLTFPFPGRAKNVNFFHAAAGEEPARLWAEFSIEPHRVCALDPLSGACGAPLFETSAAALRALPGHETTAAAGGVFFRGGACCAAVPAPPGAAPVAAAAEAGLLLGVGHVKRRGIRGFPYQYTHFFYAFDPAPPFRLRFASPEFCLLDPARPVRNATMRLRLLWPYWESPCPYLQFVSGLEVTTNGSAELLLTYGEFDCTAHAAVLSVDLVLQALRPV